MNDREIWRFYCLTPLSTIFQLYRGDQFYWGTKLEKTTDLLEVWQNLFDLTHNCSGDIHWLHR